MKLLVFAGTLEGRLLCERLNAAGVGATACTATAYGADCLKHLANITVYGQRLDADDMISFIGQHGFDTVVDATHPYARAVTENINAACGAAGATYIRLLREAGEYAGLITMPDIAAAVAYLAQTRDNVLVTTGSKELHQYCSLPDYQERLFVRVLPAVEVMARCHELGFDAKHIIAMQGPFSHELNVALLRQYECKWLVTKNTGGPGGLEAKISAAEAVGAGVVMIDRPVAETGLSLNEVLKVLGLSDS